jgi:NAD(P)-dependent dehydrogenase (short-subunit alcohol dehydrogenase family)
VTQSLELPLANKVAVVAGASAGWGRGIAEGFAAAGAQVVANGRSDAVLEVVDRIRSSGGTAIAVQGSVETTEGAARLFDAALAEYARIDIAANSVGIQTPAPLLELTEAAWDETIRIQLKSVFLCSQLAARHMVEQGIRGRILAVAGGAGPFGMPGASHHAATKGGVLAATYSWAEELSPHGITVNAIRGGVLSANMQRFIDQVALVAKSDPQQGPKSARDLGFYDPEEAAPLAVWLASDNAASVTGWFLGIDGEVVTIYGRSAAATILKKKGNWTVQDLDERLGPALQELSRQGNALTQLNPTATE